jgi:hypothetical protein
LVEPKIDYSRDPKPDKSGIGMVHFSKNRASDYWTILKPDHLSGFQMPKNKMAAYQMKIGRFVHFWSSSECGNREFSFEKCCSVEMFFSRLIPDLFSKPLKELCNQMLIKKSRTFCLCSKPSLTILTPSLMKIN